MQCVNIADFEKQARRRLPRFVFDFLVGGGEDELTLRANRADFQRIILRPRVLVDVSNCDSCTTVLGACRRKTRGEAIGEGRRLL